MPNNARSAAQPGRHSLYERPCLLDPPIDSLDLRPSLSRFVSPVSSFPLHTRRTCSRRSNSRASRWTITPCLFFTSPRHGTGHRSSLPLAIRWIIIMSKARKSISRKFFASLGFAGAAGEPWLFRSRNSRVRIIFLLFVSLSALWDPASIGEPCARLVRVGVLGFEIWPFVLLVWESSYSVISLYFSKSSWLRRQII